jgi:hypothetical protein
MEVSHKEVLKNLQEGKLPDEDVKTLEQAAVEISRKYEAKK